ncbi:MAG: hypothetical protein J6K95_03395 [Rikenellaceae bacterium]|nr:hypothetical protein [Rikenellaceae bacterium]
MNVITPITPGRFVPGELYLFHRSNAGCPPSGSLWGLFDRSEVGVIRLESSSRDLHGFRFRHPLPDGYRYFRPATRDEYRDYFYNLGYYDSVGYVGSLNRIP